MGIFKKKNPTLTSNLEEVKNESGIVNDSVDLVSISKPSVILRPLVTEKSSILAAKNTYVFIVARDANCTEISCAMKAIYKVRPIRVNTLNVRGKIVRRGRVSGKRKEWKKAIVTFPKGKTLNIYEGV